MRLRNSPRQPKTLPTVRSHRLRTSSSRLVPGNLLLRWAGYDRYRFASLNGSASRIRELRFLQDQRQGVTNGWSTRLLDATGATFGVIHRRDELGDRFAGELEDASMEVLTRARLRVPDDKRARNLAARFANDGESYLKFLTTPGLEPTNNLAEQAIRFVVIDRKVTQGSKSESGQRWLERIWTVLATCTTQNKSLLEVLRVSVDCYFRSEPPPPLLSVE